MTLTLDQFNAGRASASMAERARYRVCRVTNAATGATVSWCITLADHSLHVDEPFFVSDDREPCDMFIERRALAAGDNYAAENAKDCAEVSQAISYSHEMSEPGRVFQTLAEA